jgi:TIGR03009 family protein
LTPQQQAELDWVLKRWEEHGAEVKTFECKFTRFDWDLTWRKDQPMHVVRGEIKYAAPDKGMFRVDGEIVDFHWSGGEATGGRFVKGQRAEHWVCDGRSVFEYDFQQKRLVEHRLPPEVQGQAMSSTPLPFLFGAKAEELKQRYFLRVDALDQGNDQVWLEAYPKYQADAANFRRATLILTLSDMQPFALETVLPHGRARTVYQLHKPKVNAVNPLDPLNVFGDNWLNVRTPPGWKRVVEEVPESQAGRASAPGRMR